MSKTVRYKAKGLVLLENGFIEPMVRLEADSKIELVTQLNYLFNNGKLTVMGYTNYDGAIVGIAQETSIEIDGDEYVNTKLYLEFVGTMNQEEMDKLQKYYFEYLVKSN